MNSPKLGAVAVIKYHNKILMGLRSGNFKSGCWGLPGGHIEYGENPVTAAIRETKEETNLDIIQTEDWDLGWSSNVYEPENKHYITIFIKCELNKCWASDLVNMEPERCSEWRWFDIEEIPENLMNYTTL